MPPLNVTKACAPVSDRITDYDRAHIAVYVRLIDADRAGAIWEEAAKVIFGKAAAREPERLRVQHETHLARARWLMEKGYLQLAQKRGGRD